MRRCAFLTMHDLSGFISYDALAREPLARRGWTLEEVPWRDGAAPWGQYDLVVIRTTWDYQNHADEFSETLAGIAAQTRLENALATVRWNMRKTYLRELEQRGVRTVPTLWGRSPEPDMLRTAFSELATDELVIKPVLGANADDALWLRAVGAEVDAGLNYAANLFQEREYMLQPFVRSVLDEGEFSLIFFNGEHSHTVLKTPKPADFRVQEEHGGVIRAVRPEPLLLERAAEAMAAVTPVPLYARVDLVRLGGDFALMEMELIEPSLYLSYDEGAADRFAAAIDGAA